MKKYKLTINGQKYEASINEYSPNHAKINVNGNEYYVEIEDDTSANVPKLERMDKAMPFAPVLSSSFDTKSGDVRAPLPGVIQSVTVKEGDFVKKGQAILILEAMKMESEIAAPVSGKVLKIHKKEKALVQEGDILITIEIEQAQAEQKPETPLKARRTSDKLSNQDDGVIRAPLPGTILDIMVKVGESVRADQTIMILEAMKMESEIHCPIAGKVKSIKVEKGASVQESDILVELEV